MGARGVGSVVVVLAVEGKRYWVVRVEGLELREGEISGVKGVVPLRVC